jgi:hypothetical protein
MPIFVGTTQVNAAAVGAGPLTGVRVGLTSALGGSGDLAAPSYFRAWPGGTTADLEWGAVAGADGYTIRIEKITPYASYPAIVIPSGATTRTKATGLTPGNWLFSICATKQVSGTSVSSPDVIDTALLVVEHLSPLVDYLHEPNMAGTPGNAIVVAEGFGTCQTDNPLNVEIRGYGGVFDNRVWIRANQSGMLSGSLSRTTNTGQYASAWITDQLPTDHVTGPTTKNIEFVTNVNNVSHPGPIAFVSQPVVEGQYVVFQIRSVGLDEPTGTATLSICLTTDFEY